MAQAADDPNTSIFYKHLHREAGEGFYVLSENSELQLRHVRDGLRGLAGLARQDVECTPLPDGFTGDDLGAILEVFALATDAIIAATPIVVKGSELN